MRARTRFTLTLLAALLTICAVPAVAAASWGSKSDNGEHCSQGNGHHCYAVATWPMTGGERVEGTLAYQWTEAMNVYGWAGGDFVSNEEWVAFEPAGWWVEVGQEAGEYMDCCSLHPFYAWDNANGYTQYVAPFTVPGATNNLYQISGQNHNGTWCIYWGNAQQQCINGFYKWSNLLEVGVEAAANTKPLNTGREGTNGWWETATHAWLKEERYVDHGLCAARNPYANALGNISFSTC